MLSLTRKADYALVAMAHLAQSESGRGSAREISEHIHVPLPVLTNILHQLLHSGLVTSTMGAKGGYRLARTPDAISLADIIDAIEGRFRLSMCCSEEPVVEGEERCDLEHNCRIKDPVRKVHQSLRVFLSQVNLAQIAFDRVPVPVALSLCGNGGRATDGCVGVPAEKSEQ